MVILSHKTGKKNVQVQDMVNKIDDGSGVLDFEDFLLVATIDIRVSVCAFTSVTTQVMREKSREMDMEIHFKDAFRAFSKDDEGGDPK